MTPQPVLWINVPLLTTCVGACARAVRSGGLKSGEDQTKQSTRSHDGASAHCTASRDGQATLSPETQLLRGRASDAWLDKVHSVTSSAKSAPAVPTSSWSR